MFDAVQIVVETGLPPSKHPLLLDGLMERLDQEQQEQVEDDLDKPCTCHDFPLKVHHVTGSPGEATVEVAAALRHAALQEGIAGFAAILMENDGAVSIVAPNLPTSALAGLTRLRCEATPEQCDLLKPCGSCRVRLLVSAVMPWPIATD